MRIFSKRFARFSASDIELEPLAFTSDRAPGVAGRLEPLVVLLPVVFNLPASISSPTKIANNFSRGAFCPRPLISVNRLKSTRILV